MCNVFCVNVCVGLQEGESGEQYARGRRAQILRAIEGLPPINVSDLTFPKYTYLKQQDADQANKLKIKKQEVVAAMQAKSEAEKKIVARLQVNQ